MTPASSAAAGALVVDASVTVAITARETTADAVANAEIARYSSMGYEFFAPGVLVSETLYVLCGKLTDGTLTAAEHIRAIQDFHTLMGNILPPPHGEVSLVLRAEAIRGAYTCRRSADGIYIALAEALEATRPTTLLTFDEDMAKQAARNAPTVTIHLLRI